MVIPVDFAVVCANPQAVLALRVAASLIALTSDVSFVGEINGRCVGGGRSHADAATWLRNNRGLARRETGPKCGKLRKLSPVRCAGLGVLKFRYSVMCPKQVTSSAWINRLSGMERSSFCGSYSASSLLRTAGIACLSSV